MVCGEYEDALRELAAGMRAPEREAEVRRHLAECAACREALEAERRLLAAVDAALGEEMNAEVPPSLAARIRIRAAEEPGRLPVAWWRWATVAGMAVAVILIAVMVARRGTPPVPNRVEPAPESARRVTPAVPAPPPAMQEGSKHAASQSPKRGRGKPDTQEPEVLVPAEEEVALARFAEGLRARRGDAEALLEAMQQKPAERLEIPPIVVANLEMKALEGTKSER